MSVSGTKEAIAKFVAELKAEGIFAKEVRTAGIGAHSPYVYDSVPLLEKYFKQVRIKNSTNPRIHPLYCTRVNEANFDRSVSQSVVFDRLKKTHNQRVLLSRD